MPEFDERSTATAGYALRDKKVRFERIEAEARGFGLEIQEVDEKRPWGGFVRFAHESLENFLRAYWQSFLMDYWRGLLSEQLERSRSTTPRLELEAKVLLVAPGQRLSLQTHRRRGELWRVLEGPVVVVMGTTEENVSDRQRRPGEVVRIPSGHLHRLAAPSTGWGVVAELWLHDDPADPSDEYDIKRYDDDYWLVSEDQG